MNGRVLFIDDAIIEMDRITILSSSFKRRFYVYGRGVKGIPELERSLKDFVFMRLEDVSLPQNINLIVDNTEEDFIVIKCVRFSNIMDRNIEKLQNMAGYKLVIDSHPFLGKSEVYWGYFLWSFFDRSLLGYPHCYAFRAAFKNAPSPMDCRELALKVLPKSETTMRRVFGDDIITRRIALDPCLCDEYQRLKQELFATQTSSAKVIKSLRRFLVRKLPDLKEGFDLAVFGRVFDQYGAGIRELILTDQKVDIYLETEFWNYIKNANAFVETIWDNQKK